MDLRTLTIVGFSLLSSTSCHQRHRSDDPAGQTSDKIIAVNEVDWGFMQARVSTGGNTGRVSAIRTSADYRAFAAAMSDDGYLELGEHFATPPSFDPSREVLLFIELPDGAGSELRPIIAGIERDGDVARVHAHWAKNPEGSMTDDVSRTWVLVRAPIHALANDPTLTLIVCDGR